MPDFAFTPGPYSVHPYTEIQGKRTIESGGETYEVACITIGAGRKMLGEVSYYSKVTGFPRIESEAEMRAVAALWIAAPAMAEVLTSWPLNELLGMIEDSGDPKMWERALWFMENRDAALALLNPEPTPAVEVVL